MQAKQKKGNCSVAVSNWLYNGTKGNVSFLCNVQASTLGEQNLDTEFFGMRDGERRLIIKMILLS